MEKHKLTNDNCRYVYLPGLPPKIKGFVMEDDGYYTIVLNPSLSADTNAKTRRHEVRHILRDDFNKDNCDSIEKATHK